jgi:hypothetical protein
VRQGDAGRRRSGNRTWYGAYIVVHSTGQNTRAGLPGRFVRNAIWVQPESGSYRSRHERRSQQVARHADPQTSIHGRPRVARPLMWCRGVTASNRYLTAGRTARSVQPVPRDISDGSTRYLTTSFAASTVAAPNNRPTDACVDASGQSC